MEQRQHFGLRKSKAAKTLCGAILSTFLLLSAQIAHADENTSPNTTTEPTQTTSTTMETSASVANSGSTATTNLDATQPLTVVAESTASVSPVATSEASTTPVATSTAPSTEVSTAPVATNTEANTAPSTEVSAAPVATNTDANTVPVTENTEATAPKVRSRRSAESIDVTFTTDNADKTITATSSTETPAQINELPPHVFNINASGVGEIPENSYVEVTVKTNSELKKYNNENPLKKGFKATGYTTNEDDYTGSTQTAKINISGLSAGTQKQFIVEPNNITGSFPVSSNFARVTTYKLVVDGVVKNEKTITETFIPKEPKISLDTSNPNSLLRIKMPGKPDRDVYSSADDIVTLLGKRNYGKYKVTLPKTVKLPTYSKYEIPGTTNTEYIIPQNVFNTSGFTSDITADTESDAVKELNANPDAQAITHPVTVAYYYSDKPFTNDDLTSTPFVTTSDIITTKINILNPGEGHVKVNFKLNDNEVSVLETPYKNEAVATLDNGTEAEPTNAVLIPKIQLTLNTEDKPFENYVFEATGVDNRKSDSRTRTGGNSNIENLRFTVYNADTNEELGVTRLNSPSHGRLSIPTTVKKIRIEANDTAKLGYLSDSDLLQLNYRVSFNTTVQKALDWKLDMDKTLSTKTATRFRMDILDDNNNPAATAFQTLDILNGPAVIQATNNTLVRFAPEDIKVDGAVPIKVSKLLSKSFYLTSILNTYTKVYVKAPDGLINGTKDADGYIELTTDKIGEESAASVSALGDDTFADVSATDPGSYKYGFVKLPLNLPAGNHEYQIKVKLVPQEPVRTLSATDTIGNEPSEATYTIYTYDSRTQVVSSQMGYETQVGDKVAVEDYTKGITARTTIMNFTDNPITEMQAISYIPKQGLEKSTVSTTLKDAIVAKPGWKIQYTTGAITGDYSQDRNLTFTDTVSDYSKVTAIKFSSTEAVKSMSGASFDIPLSTSNLANVDDIINYRSVLLTPNDVVLSSPVSATPVIGNVVYHFIDSATNKELREPEEHPMKLAGNSDSYTYPDKAQFTVDGVTKTYHLQNATEPETVINGTTHVKRYYNKAETTVQVRYVWDSSLSDDHVNFLVNDLMSERRMSIGSVYKPRDFKINSYLNLKFPENTAATIPAVDDYGIARFAVDLASDPVTFTYVRTEVTRSSDLESQISTENYNGLQPKDFTTTDEMGNVTVTHYYKVEYGNFVEHFVDENGNKIADDYTTPNGLAGYTILTTSKAYQNYDVLGERADWMYAPEKPKTITVGDVEYTYVRQDKDEPIKIEQGTQEVTYIYKRHNGRIIQRFVDTEGNELQAQTTTGLLPIGPLATPLTHPSEITHDGYVYKFINQDKVDPTEIKAEDTIVTYVYGTSSIPNEAPVTDKPELQVTRYVDESGKEIKDMDKGLQPKADISGYTYDHTDEVPSVRTHVYKVFVSEVPNEAPVTDKPELQVTRYVDESGKEIKDMDKGLQPKADISGYTYNHTDEVPGVRTHVYNVFVSEIPNEAPVTDKPELQVTRYVDESGKEIKDMDKGLQPKADISGYTYNHTDEVPGVRTHVYNVFVSEIPNEAPVTDKPELQVTRYVDESGKEIKDMDKGLQPKADISGYTYNHTDDVPGVRTHVYNVFVSEVPNEAPVTDKPELQVTRYVDESGKEIKDMDKGLQPKADISGYTYNHTDEVPGVRTHVYNVFVSEIPNDAPVTDKPELQVTRYVDESGKEIKDMDKGLQPKANISGYTYNHTDDVPGVRTHVYNVFVSEIPNDAPVTDKPELQVTRYVDETGKEIKDIDKGLQPKADISGYTYNHTDEVPGVRTHVYNVFVSEIPNEAPVTDKPELQVTRYVDESGKEIKDMDKGLQPKANISGYTYNHTDEVPGVRTHVYNVFVSEIPNEAPVTDKPELQVTRYVDETGKEIKDMDKGLQPKADISGYTYDHTDEVPGVRTHVYKVIPETPKVPETPKHDEPKVPETPKREEPKVPETQVPETPKATQQVASTTPTELPHTGDMSEIGTTILGMWSLMGASLLVAGKKRKD